MTEPSYVELEWPDPEPDPECRGNPPPMRMRTKVSELSEPGLLECAALQLSETPRAKLELMSRTELRAYVEELARSHREHFCAWPVIEISRQPLEEDA